MKNRFLPCSHKAISAMALLASLVVLGGCFGDDENWNGKDISGLMPELAFELTGTSGDTITAEQTDGQIRLLFFGFTSCPDICPATLQKLSRAVKDLPEALRTDTQIVFVSVDPQRDTPERIDSYVSFFSDRAIGLTGEEPALRELSKRYRTTFGYDEPDAEGNYNVSHSGAVYVFDREGKARLLIRPELSVEDIRTDLVALAEES
ncbi:putative Cytochrome oxidase biogenesis protein Sco1/SenC/PrrC, copper metallochaperone [Marinobacter salarius]|jgi:protein SCO1/2|uniref:SCO family protein n=2 Tax=Marinobacter TaxID=2742 RepID=UPI00125A2ADC|nr:Electron transporter SenC [Marinobacter salarius]VXC39178.1 putative Cytochrome oxidase biogenesis protein Sco1/SenC/PrrC, copper metallochaperone [Marinobacter salarius]